jgi:molybdate transport system regulatory protein
MAEAQAMRKQNTFLKPKMKLWFSTRNAEGVFGDGKWRILKAIERMGSLKAAAASFGMSLRTAWGDIQKAEKHLGVVLVTRQRGGKRGGGTVLTPEGKRWIAAYARFRAEMEKTAEGAFRKHISPLGLFATKARRHEIH